VLVISLEENHKWEYAIKFHPVPPVFCTLTWRANIIKAVLTEVAVLEILWFVSSVIYSLGFSVWNSITGPLLGLFQTAL